MSNGSLYDVDQGVEPDIVIDKIRTNFCHYLHNAHQFAAGKL